MKYSGKSSKQDFKQNARLTAKGSRKAYSQGLKSQKQAMKPK